ncbi:hypothetical protein P4O66_012607 [Electrophorus voltai]|uniref:Uncharacterized protein n=1 Tax=Electrophorus voltai TaxID=2609070 RepID=A0AAD8Z6X6_9TELE|nr:hypothetical protein P4O66_012607 [Electrophorus voltai]
MAVPGAHPVSGGLSAISKEDLTERPRGGLPPRLWADPSSLAVESNEGKGLRRSRWLHLTALCLVAVVPLGPPRPRFNSLRPPPRNS